MDSIMSHYTFREQVFKNLKLNESVECSAQGKVTSFLRQIEEPAQVIIHENILSIVPDSQKSLFECHTHLINNLSPQVSLERDDIEKLKEKVKQEFLEAKEKEKVDDFSKGIFGDDDYYSLQFSQVHRSSAPTASAKRKEAATSEIQSLEAVKKAKVVSKEKINFISFRFNHFYFSEVKEENDNERIQEEEKANNQQIKVEEESSSKDQDYNPEAKTPRTTRQLRRTNRRANGDSTRLKNSRLSPEQQEQLHELVEKSKSGKIYTCCECSSTLKSKFNIYYHIEHIHLLPKIKIEQPEIGSSNLTTEQKRQLIDLFEKSKTEEGFKCPICFRAIIKRINMIKHIEQLHILKNGTSIQGSDSIRLKNSKLPESQKPILKELVDKSKFGSYFKCHICEAILHTRQSIYYHIENRHILKQTSYETCWVSKRIQEAKNKGGSNDWECSECSKMYISQQALRAHLKLHYKSISGSSSQVKPQ
jgi:hypothetical protein